MKMRGYILAEIEITNPEGYKAYSAVVLETIQKYGGKFLSRGGANTPLEGEWLQRRRVILEFPTVEAARKWYDSPEYEKPKALRKANSNGRLLLLEGVAP
jgi:uncharacterized protein (DUF1330 family)